MIEYTGERYLPWIENAQAGYEHFHRYAFVQSLVGGKRVLDMATGEGYGAAMLAMKADRVVGIDIDGQVISHASSRYVRKNLEFIQGSMLDIPNAVGAAFDIAVCFEAIEHVDDQAKVLVEAKRLLKKKGLLFISTPNRRAFSDEQGEDWPFHTKEFYFDEFRDLLGDHFKHCLLLGQKVFTGSTIWPLLQETDASTAAREILIERSEKEFRVADSIQNEPVFFLAIAADADLSPLGEELNARSYLFDLSSRLIEENRELLEEHKHQIDNLQQFIERKDEDLLRSNRELETLRSSQNELVRQQSAMGSTLEDLASLLGVKQHELEQITQENVIIKERIRSLEPIVQDYETARKEHQELRNELENAREEFEGQLEQMDSLSKNLAAVESERASLANQLESVASFIRKKDEDIRIAVDFIEEIHRSLGFRILMRYRVLIDRIAPSSSRRRRAYVSLLKSIQALSSQREDDSSSPPHGVAVSTQSAATIDPPLTPYSNNAVCTIASKNYLGFLRVLAQSVRNTNPDLRVIVLLVDRIEGMFDPELEPFELVTVEDLGNIPNLQQFMFKYSAIELNTAVKPYFIQYLFDKYGFKKITYLDPDIQVFQNLEGLWRLLDYQAIVLTPHLMAPYNDDSSPTENEINQAGIFNLGFIAISDNAHSRAFLEWWKDKLYDSCFMDPSAGLHVDQKWVNFAPTMFEGVFILRDPAYNIAYWNLHNRGHRLRYVDGALHIDGRSAVFFHFSGLNPEGIEAISIHQNRYRLSDFRNLRPLFEDYRDALKAQGALSASDWDYAFGKFKNGVRIPEPARLLFHEQMNGTAPYGDPFDTDGPDSFYAWLQEPADGNHIARPAITNLHMQLHRMRPDLIRAYPNPLGADRVGFWGWLVSTAGREFDLDTEFVQVLDDQDLYDFRDGNFGGRISAAIGRTVLRLRAAVRPRAARLAIGRPRLRKFLLKWDEKVVRAYDPIRNWPAQRSDWRTLPFGINVAGYIGGEFGVAEIARASIAALDAVNIPHALNNIVTDYHRHKDETFVEFSDSNPYRVNLIHVNADQVPMFESTRGPGYFRNHYNIGVWFWELSDFPTKWKSSFRNLDEIWVATSFCQDSISKQSPIPVLRMPFPILVNDSSVEKNRKRFGIPPEPFIFLFHFDYLSVFERKNPLGLIECYGKAFGDRKDALLIIKTINSTSDPAAADQLRKASDGLNVLTIDRHFNRSEMISLTATCDCYISLHRSEGYGLGMAQAMYLEKPVIATAYSGNTEFMDVNNSLLVRHNIVELDRDYGPYPAGSVWAEPDLEHSAELMLRAFEGGNELQQITRRAASDIRAHFSPAHAGEAMSNRLNEIMA